MRRTRYVENDLKLVDVKTGWYDAGIVGGQNKIVPSITLKLQNVSDESISRVQVWAVFRRANEDKTWGEHFVRAIGAEGLDPGKTGGALVLRSTLGLHRRAAAGADAAEPRVRRRQGQRVRQARLAHVDQDGRVHRRPPPARSPPNSAAPRRDATYNPAVPTQTPSSSAPVLERRLSPFDAAAIIVANVIGGGILFRSPAVAAAIPDAIWFLLAWVAGGVLAFMGAMAYAELAALRPKAGGEYVYLREAYGPLAGFLTGWTSFVAGFSGAIAASAVFFIVTLDRFVPGIANGDALLAIPVPLTSFAITFSIHTLAASGLIVLFALIHILGVGPGAPPATR